MPRGRPRELCKHLRWGKTSCPSCRAAYRSAYQKAYRAGPNGDRLRRRIREWHKKRRLIQKKELTRRTR